MWVGSFPRWDGLSVFAVNIERNHIFIDAMRFKKRRKYKQSYEKKDVCKGEKRIIFNYFTENRDAVLISF